ncbi:MULTISPECIES: sigma-70 family RNA polymerase sigma factor [unclassified Mesorhizobium]|uniref:sigma-70 family RNA polymerase sigma factor n=2 Tax=Mesorhizobium TaxID=68287 RepID=UPI000FD8523F|nr:MULTISPECIES: sigma-70 family RNA polymerase sigma factor [unclassified Mesorhizobium]TGR39960.1 sigma-70 family RNA polymerase sigma factor [bacterium M00.F.Ca.ET.199.01.1.1]TGU24165.1 sigma-70 family RNA polymerase sigma factor [bacterium M00.F.Ca.ET.156.01.1.1]TGV89379.1 sigma-70 family RNA polymerase sigma factor [Mesorhizobium sp. M00.F.Ca.ET.149.01.1.1]TGR23337.1 sigma-70 family RNA polymerase sigma factor [Mesorhizobium sp. M8A.F.Ca.ET.202.01.1.1]TGR24570.1 sigma-70 family RNA polyme
MAIMDRFSLLLGGQGKTAIEPGLHPLDVAEIRMIADARTERLAGFASSPRLHARDPKGDTPLHIAARMGNLVLCDLFIRAGSDPLARNHERQTPADVAFAEGHLLAAQLLFSLPGEPQVETSRDTFVDMPQGDVETEEGQSPPAGSAPLEGSEDRIDLLTFEPEEDPEYFFDRSVGNSASGTFVALLTSPPTGLAEADVDWAVDLSPASISGDGIGSDAAIAPDQGGDHDFLKVRNRGRQSAKRAVLQSGTRLSIDPDICLAWSTEILEKRWFSSYDVDALILLCEGNGDPDELRVNLLRTLEVAGLELFDGENENSDVLWDIRSEVSADELAEAIEANFTRATRLPGTRRFDMDKSNEARLLDPMVRAKQELQLGILSSEPAVKGITGAIDKVLDGTWKPQMVTTRTIVPSRPESSETAAFSNAGQVLRKWNATGRVMDGKRRREALQALEALDLSPAFQGAIVTVLAEQPSFVRASRELTGLISVFETAVERLVIEHLPYARRFAARNAEDREDPEDVFQVAFIGLQRATRRFDAEHGHRFVHYSTFWMKQFLTRWRGDEGALIRVPVHRHQRLADLDRAIERLDARNGCPPTDDELAIELAWPLESVRQFLRIPRQCFDLGCLDDWEGVGSEADQEHFLGRAEMARIASEALVELPERQADVIRMRFGIGRDDEMTLEEIGQIYGVTRERIRQIEAKGLKYLSHPARKRPLQALLGI